MSLIRLKEVSKKFDRKQVLRRVHFRLEKGNRVGLLGNNGVGKTTVLKIILGREEPTEGQIERDEDLRIGYFSQFSELSGDVSIEQVSRMGSRLSEPLKPRSGRPRRPSPGTRKEENSTGCSTNTRRSWPRWSTETAGPTTTESTRY